MEQVFKQSWKDHIGKKMLQEYLRADVQQVSKLP